MENYFFSYICIELNFLGMKLVMEEKTKTTNKKVFVDENGREETYYYLIDDIGNEKRTNISAWAISKFRENHNVRISLDSL